MQLSSVVPAKAPIKLIPPLRNPVFVADIHLSDDKPETKKAFFKFLTHDAMRFNELVILGDLFEFWPGDDAIEMHKDVVDALRQYVNSGKKLYLMHGNRDFLLGQDFELATGGFLLEDPIVVKVGVEQVVLSHGDMWCSLDNQYHQFRSTLRDPEIQASILKEKLEHRIDLANSLRRQSQDDNMKKDSDVMDVVIHDVGKTLKNLGVNTVIHGHTHKPSHHTHVYDDYRFDRWVLPDWDMDNGNNRGGYISFENGYIHFGHFD